ncbi:AraC family transcriptional regulator [Microseira wollei]|uniref:Transcriptional Regulator, AraC family protein n=1 Tax=Microseira wollei NIES-4236 TaxID=2530354 RepID=A0AAV3WI12_9CYAN|nr:AraC family transcriptional regulator [Microseira wollei]GET38904.1 transcriptional Regulator, AraC family protein [Microseira wollei NIES-4236]
MLFPKTKQTAAILRREWDGLTVEYGRLDAVGEFDFAMPKHVLSVAFAPHEQVTWSVDGGQRQSTSLPAGSVFVYGQREFVWHRRVKPSEYINLALDPALLQTIATENGLSSTTEIEHRVIFQDPTILHVAQLLKAEVLNGGLAGNLYVESLRNLLAVHLLRNHTRVLVKPTVEAGHRDGLKLKQLKDYIEEHLAQELAIATLAAQIPMSQFHFARAFKAATGESPHRYIMQRRIERAKILLSVARLTVAEVAYQVGFSNQSHFTAQFRKAIGMTPKQFRECA